MAKKQGLSIGILGSGNMAFCLGKALKIAGYPITEVYSRNLKEGKKLSLLLDSKYVSSVEKLNANADIYFYCLQDEAIEMIADKTAFLNKIKVHTSGSISMNVFRNSSSKFGVFYPVQSFSKEIQPDWENIPVCIEGSDEVIEKTIRGIAKKISRQVYVLESSKRRVLHLSAVFANNFSNACFAMSEDILSEANIPFSLLRPLILNSALKVQKHHPYQVQTGPAMRNDQEVIKTHEQLLNAHPELKKIYKLITQYIRQSHSE